MVGIDYPLERVTEDMVIIAVGKPPLQLFQLSQVLVADLVEGSYDAPSKRQGSCRGAGHGAAGLVRGSSPLDSSRIHLG